MKTKIVVFVVSIIATLNTLAGEPEEVAPVTGQYTGHIAGADGNVTLVLLQERDFVHGIIRAHVGGKKIEGIILGKRSADRVILWFLAGDDIVLDMRINEDKLKGSFIDGWPDANRDHILTFEEAKNHFDDPAIQKHIKEHSDLAVVFSRINHDGK